MTNSFLIGAASSYSDSPYILYVLCVGGLVVPYRHCQHRNSETQCFENRIEAATSRKTADSSENTSS
ncbi:hypothetical protein V6N13_045098 [Hibiscus sabdariffa]